MLPSVWIQTYPLLSVVDDGHLTRLDVQVIDIDLERVVVEEPAQEPLSCLLFTVANLLYLKLVPDDSRLTVGKVTVTLPLLPKPISR